MEIPFSGSTLLPYVSADTNWVPLGYECVEMATYITTVTFPQSITGYVFAYQRCCRTGSILNLVDPLLLGGTYWEQVPATALANNSPIFNSVPPLVLCINRPMTFNHAATDLDGDSLVYHLCGVYEGANQADPYPLITSPPPFVSATFQAPYSAPFPLPGSPMVTIDSITGVVQVTPTALGNYMVGICCDEYRNGTYLGTHHSDFRYTVAECPYGIGINEENLINVHLFPNPATEIIRFESDEIFKLVIFDVMGKEMYSSTNENAQHNIDISNWSNGIYYYQLMSKGGGNVGKFMKVD